MEGQPTQDETIVSRAVKALLNGTGAKLTQVMVVVGFPLVSALAVWGYNLSLENQRLQMQNIDQKLERAIGKFDAIEPRLNAVENSVGRIEERQASTDARLTRLENGKR